MSKNEKILLVAIILWGLSGVVNKVILQSTSELTFIWVRFLIAALILTVMYGSKLKNINFKTIKYGSLLGVITVAGFLLELTALKIMDVSKLYFIISIETVGIPIMAYLLYRHKTSKKEAIGAIIACLGLLVINMKGANILFGWGEVIAITCMIAYSFKVVYMSNNNKKYDSILTTIIMFYSAAVIGFVANIATEGFNFKIGTEGLLFIGISIIFMTIIPFLCEIYAFKNLIPARAGVLYALSPIFTFLAAMIFLGEFMSLEGYIGSAIIFFALMFVTVQLPKKKGLKE